MEGCALQCGAEGKVSHPCLINVDSGFDSHPPYYRSKLEYSLDIENISLILLGIDEAWVGSKQKYRSGNRRYFCLRSIDNHL